jgi:hypothetical protein
VLVLTMASKDELRGWLLFLLIVLAAHAVSQISQSARLLSISGGADGPGEEEGLSRWEETPWRHIGTFKSVETFVKQVPGSKLHAFRGTTVLKDLHISSAIAHFYDTSLAHQWIETLDSISEYSFPPPQSAQERDPRAEEEWRRRRAEATLRLQPLTESLKTTDLVYQVTRLPWPVSYRDVLLQRDWDYDVSQKTVTVKYHSISDPIRCPEQKRFVRAISPHTLWRFKAVPGGATQVEIECIVDSKGSVPAFLVNWFQRSFPADSLTAFYALAKKGIAPPHGRVVDW